MEQRAMMGMQSRHQTAVQWTHFLLRVVAGAVLTQHGAQVLFGVLRSAHAAVMGLTLPRTAGLHRVIS